MGRTLLCAAVSLVAVVALGSCSPNLGAAPFKCSTAGQCPDGYTCNPANLCVKDGSCPAELPGCGDNKDECGDDKCAGKETCESCEKDCGRCAEPHCGDGKCEGDETCGSCEGDCGKCTTPPPGNCGDGKCEAPETCSSCEADCGKCAEGCGDGKCEGDETCSSCEADCGTCPTNNCGNGTCDPGETELTCPADCTTTPPPECQDNETQCQDTETLRYCNDSKWVTESCETICKTEGFDYKIKCELSSQVNKEICLCGNYAKFGEICDDAVKCAPDLFCGAFDTTSPKGYCTKYCTNPGGFCSGAPLGTEAECVLEVNAQNACGFTCSSFLASCPTGLSCDPVSFLCKP